MTSDYGGPLMTHYCERCNREILPDERTFHSERDRFCSYCRRYNAVSDEAYRLRADLAAATARAEAAEALLARFVAGVNDEYCPLFRDELMSDEVALLDEAEAFLASARANKEQGDD